MGSWGQVMPDGSVQRRKTITWDASIHVMLDVEIHLPIKEPHHGMGGKGPTTAASIWSLTGKSAMLGIVAEPEKPIARQAMETERHRHPPPTLVQGNSSNDEMPKNDVPGPTNHLFVTFSLSRREAGFHPWPIEPSARQRIPSETQDRLRLGKAGNGRLFCPGNVDFRSTELGIASGLVGHLP